MRAALSGIRRFRGGAAGTSLFKRGQIERPQSSPGSCGRAAREDEWDSVRNPLVGSWDFLIRTPETETPLNYRLRGELGRVARDGATHDRWQHKPTLKGDARIWFYFEGQVVYLEQVHTSHSNQAKT